MSTSEGGVAPPIKRRGMGRWLIVAVIAIIIVVALIAVVVLGGYLTPTKYGLEKVKSQGKIIMATEATFQPFESRGPSNGTFYGFDIDLANKIAENVSKKVGKNITLEIHDVAFSTIPASLQNNQYDMSLSGMTITSKRNESVLFSIPYYKAEAGYGLMVKNGTTGIASIDDVVNQSKTIVVNTGTTSEFWVQENLINKGKISADKVKSLPTIANCVQDVIAGKSDVFIIDKPTVDDYVKTSGGAVIDVGTIEANEPYGVAFNKNAGDLKAVADEVISNMTSNGEMDALRAKWGL